MCDISLTVKHQRVWGQGETYAMIWVGTKKDAATVTVAAGGYLILIDLINLFLFLLPS